VRGGDEGGGCGGEFCQGGVGGEVEGDGVRVW
jgi:hypothetical protein